MGNGWITAKTNVVMVVMVLAGCTAGSSPILVDSEPTASATTANGTVAVTQSTTLNAAPETTPDSASSTEVETQATTATQAPTTERLAASGFDEATDAAIRADVVYYQGAFLDQLLLFPDFDPKVLDSLTVKGSPRQEGDRRFFASKLEAGTLTRRAANDVVITKVGKITKLSSTRAMVVWCGVNNRVVYKPGVDATDPADDVIVSANDIGGGIATGEWALEDGRWKPETKTAEGVPVKGEQGCDAI